MKPSRLLSRLRYVETTWGLPPALALRLKLSGVPDAALFAAVFHAARTGSAPKSLEPSELPADHPSRPYLAWAGKVLKEEGEESAARHRRRFPGLGESLEQSGRAQGIADAIEALFDTGVLDWVASEKPADLMRWTLQDARAASAEWHRELASVQGAETIQQGLVVARDEDGWTLQRLHRAVLREEEGASMGHCVGSGGYDSVPVFSLRSPSGRPCVTIACNTIHWITEIQGRANTRPKESYLRRLRALLPKSELRRGPQRVLQSDAEIVQALNASPTPEDIREAAARCPAPSRRSLERLADAFSPIRDFRGFLFLVRRLRRSTTDKKTGVLSAYYVVSDAASSKTTVAQSPWVLDRLDIIDYQQASLALIQPLAATLMARVDPSQGKGSAYIYKQVRAAMSSEAFRDLLQRHYPDIKPCGAGRVLQWSLDLGSVILGPVSFRGEWAEVAAQADAFLSLIEEASHQTAFADLPERIWEHFLWIAKRNGCVLTDEEPPQCELGWPPKKTA